MHSVANPVRGLLKRKISEGHLLQSSNESIKNTKTRQKRLIKSSTTMLGYDWWLCMVINVSVQYFSGGLLPDIILLT